MKTDRSIFLNCLTFSLLLVVCTWIPAMSQDTTSLPKENFYTKSLHYTNRGIVSAYSKERGGLERLTGMSAKEIGCEKSECHATTCDVCHKKVVDGKATYTLDTAIAYAACTNCHGDMAKDNPDVHFAKGMKCMDCHTTREIHGDGTEVATYAQPGFFDVRCEKCHTNLSQSISHTVHAGKLDCTPCHVQEVNTCYNCHVDTRLKKGKESSIQLKNMEFLVNHDGKVTLANFLSYVYQNKTMMTFGPTFPHRVVKVGRTCTDCHDTKIVRDVKEGKFAPVRWENEKLQNVNGVVPVYDVAKWNCVFLTKENNKWIPLKDPVEPLVNYSGYCSPLTNDQITKLAAPQAAKK